ncbi:MAG: hypothetical protein KDC34_04800 [Saprospiraceae bacterium]|nr:hypothetical protein [Saprospiraceae bacterium]
MFKNIKSLFVLEDENPSPKTTSKSESNKGATTPDSGSPVVRESPAGVRGQVTIKFMDVLFAAMEKNNLDGFDYLEYKQSLQSLAKMPMDEATRYQSAYAMAQTMGATPQKLIQSASHYIQVLQAEEQKFQVALANQKQQNISEKEKLANDLDLTVKTKEEAIKKLQQEIETTRKQQQSLRKEVESATIKVESTKNDFIASFNKLVSQINQDMEAMKNYLK